MTELPFLAGEQGKGPLLVLLFFLAAAFVFAWGSWEGTVPATEEAVVAEAAREIASSGDVWPIRINGEADYSVAPGAPWMISVFFVLFGASALTARLPFILSGLLILFVTYITGERGQKKDSGGSGWIDASHAVGLLSAVILAMSAIFARNTVHITENIPLTFFLILSLAGWLSLPERKSGILLWTAGIAGAVLSAGSGGLLPVAGALFSMIFDDKRRKIWKDPIFISATAIVLILSISWLRMLAGARAGGDIPGLLPGAFTSPRAPLYVALWDSIKNVSIYTMPWAVPAAAGCCRTVISIARREKVDDQGRLDRVLVSFGLIFFIPAALVIPVQSGIFLPVAPLIAILAAREIARWLRSTANLWTLDQGLIALICFLMLLLAATPLKLHRREVDPVEELVFMAAKMVREGDSIGNYRFGGRERGAQVLFCCGSRLDPSAAEPLELDVLARKNPGKIFATTSEGLSELYGAGLKSRISILYRVDDLLLIRLDG